MWWQHYVKERIYSSDMLNPVDLTSALGLLDYPVIKVY